MVYYLIVALRKRKNKALWSFLGVIIVLIISIATDLPGMVFKARLCMELDRNPLQDPLCNLGSGYQFLFESSFPIGVTSRQEVRNSLNEYWIEEHSGAGFGVTGKVDYYKISFSLLDGMTVFIFDEDDILVDIRVYD